MEVRLTYDSFNCWTQEKIVEIQDYASHEDIQALFQVELRIPYNKHECSYEVIGGGCIHTEQEMFSCSD